MALMIERLFTSMLKYPLFLTLFAVAFISSPSSYAKAQGGKKKRYASIVFDYKTQKILYARYAKSPRYPASLTKMMTLYLIFDKLEAKKITLKSRWRVSQKAAQQPPSKLGLKKGETLTVENAIYALVTKSANDVAMVVAENIAKSEQAFAHMMTKKASSLGMLHTVFKNPSGLYHPQQVTTAQDMLVLARSLLENHPSYYKYFSTKNFSYKGKKYRNHNNLLKSFQGLDGLKTGYINASGFNLAASAVRNGNRIIAVVMGGVKAKARDNHMRELLERGFSSIKQEKGSNLYALNVIPPSPKRKPALNRGTTLYQKASYEQSENTPPQHLSLQTSYPSTQRPVKAIPKSYLYSRPENRQRYMVYEEQKKTTGLALLSSQTDLSQHASKERHIKKPASTGPDQKHLMENLKTSEKFSQLLNHLEENLSSPPHPRTSQTYVKADQIKTVFWSVQVGAFKKKEKAQDHLIKIEQESLPMLKTAHAVVQTFENKGDLYYRARFTGLDKAQAKKACSFLTEKKLNCVALAPAL